MVATDLRNKVREGELAADISQTGQCQRSTNAVTDPS
jgi:hypothetical protein